MVLSEPDEREPPFCANIGCISIKALAAQIQLFCALSRVGRGDRIHPWPGRGE
jgi:hypothetical protein